jgi:hypothetical protein
MHDQRFGRRYAALRAAVPLSLRSDFALSHGFFLAVGVSLPARGVGPVEWVSARLRSHFL